MSIQRPAQHDGTEGVCYRRPLENREICLLELAPAVSQDSPIKVNFRPCSLDSNELPDFEMTSYAWGGAEDDRVEISCEGKGLMIMKNLSDALLFLRSRHRPRILWADSISIDQSNRQERSAQVGLMPIITWKAARSNIWIGPRMPSTKSAFELLSKLLEVRNFLFKGPLLLPPQGNTPSLQQLEDYRRMIPAPSSPDWKALEELLDARFFTR